MNDKQIKEIYDGFGFDGQNMTLADFRREIKDLTDPVKMQADLAEIELMKARERTNKIRIDRSLN